MKMNSAKAFLLWTCFLQVYGTPISYEGHSDQEKELQKRAPSPGILPDIPVPEVPAIIPKPEPITVPAPKPAEPAPAPAPKPADPAPAPAPNSGNPAPAPAPAPPAALPEDVEPDEAALCKRSGCDLNDATLAAIRQDAQNQDSLLDVSISNKQADTGSKQNIEPLYTRVNTGNNGPPVLQQDSQTPAWFEQFGYQNTKGGWTSSVVTNSEEQIQRLANLEEAAPATILKTYQNPDNAGGVILVSKSENKNEDALVTNPVPGTPATRWSDMVMDNWRQTSGTNIQNLKWIFRDNVQDADEEANLPSSQGLIDKALEIMGQDSDKDIKFEIPKPIPTSPQTEKDAYYTLAGTVHVDRVVKMLKDHHQELGDLEIQSIFIVKAGEYNLAIQLGKAPTN